MAIENLSPLFFAFGIKILHLGKTLMILWSFEWVSTRIESDTGQCTESQN